MTDEPKAQRASECCFCTAGERLNQMLRNFKSSETGQHFRNSRIEFLKGLRSILDGRIDRLSRHQAKGAQVTVE